MMIINKNKKITDDFSKIEGVESSFKTTTDVKEMYLSREDIPNERAYTVYSYATGDVDEKGNLNYGLSVLEPIQFNGEYNMTRGHFHNDPTCVEFYWCLGGTGLLMLMDENTTWVEELEPGSIHRIEGNWGHRLINTGTEQLKVGAVWSPGAGYNYEKIEKRPFEYCSEPNYLD